MNRETHQRKIKLSAFFLPSGHHVSSWRHPKSKNDGGINFNHYVEVAKIAERGKFDMIFLSDTLGIRSQYKNNEELSKRGHIICFEPTTILAALSTATKNLGLVATASTTYNEPYNIARRFATIDFISNGRVGWNVVTSRTDIEAQNFNMDKHPEHSKRYQRAREFIEVVTGLWNSWDIDAFIVDKQSGIYFDPNKLRVLNHKGEFFSVKGPLNIVKSPQGKPVIIQAGSSEDGQDFAAEWGEVVFTAHQTLQDAQSFYSSLKSQVINYGRSPQNLLIMPGIFPIIGNTYNEAKQKYEELQNLIDPQVGLSLLSGLLGDVVDINSLQLDKKLPPLDLSNASTGKQRVICEMAKKEGLTVRQLYKSVAGSRGHKIVLGTAKDIADQLEEWFINNGADGFNIMSPCLPNDLNDFVDLVVPELQRRGLFREDYEGSTLRDNLGIM